MTNVATTKAAVIPCLRYRDASAATDWLGDTFGFEKRLVIPGGGGGVVHARLSFSGGMIMIVFERAKAAGATIAIGLKDEDFGSRGFSCRDLEGHLWNFGTDDPWQDA